MSEPSLTIELNPAAQALLARLPNLSADAAKAIAAELDKQNELTIGYAQRNKLSAAGPLTLGVRSGLLRRSLHKSDATIKGDIIESAIGSNVIYAGVHEYGFDGDVDVRPFARRNRRRDIKAIKWTKRKSDAGARYVRKQVTVAQGVSYVKGFTRHMRMPQRSFIRSSIEERLSKYSAGFSRAVIAALGGGQ